MDEPNNNTSVFRNTFDIVLYNRLLPEERGIHA